MTLRPIVIALIVLLASHAPTSSAQSAASAQTALVGGRLVDGTGRPAIENAAIVIQGERIVAAGALGKVDIPASANIISVEGKTILPGLIESNGHILFGGQSNHVLYFAKRRQQLYEIGARNLYTSLMQGITTIRDTMADLDTAVRLRGDVASGKIAGARVYTSGVILNYPGMYALLGEATKTASPDVQSLTTDEIRALEAWVLVVRDGEHGRQIVRDYARRGADFIKISADSRPRGKPPELSVDAMRQIIDEAHKHGLPVTTHTGSVEGVRAVLDAGVDAMEHPELFDDPVPTGGLPKELAERAARQHVYSIPLLVANEVYVRYLDRPSRLNDPYFIRNAPADLVQEGRDWVSAELERGHNGLGHFSTDWWTVVQVGRESVKRLIDAGAPIAMGTDKGTRLNFHESSNHVREMEIYVELGMSPMDAIVSATRRGAEVLRKQNELGTVEPGKLADVIVVDGNPLERISALRKVAIVFKGGVRCK